MIGSRRNFDPRTFRRDRPCTVEVVPGEPVPAFLVDLHRASSPERARVRLADGSEVEVMLSQVTQTPEQMGPDTNVPRPDENWSRA